jgi:hypothetical protein
VLVVLTKARRLSIIKLGTLVVVHRSVHDKDPVDRIGGLIKVAESIVIARDIGTHKMIYGAHDDVEFVH